MQQLSVGRFVALPHANELVLYYWAQVVKATSGSSELISGKTALKYIRGQKLKPLHQDSPEAVYPVRLLVQCMVVFRESLNAWSGKGKSDNANGVFMRQILTF